MKIQQNKKQFVVTIPVDVMRLLKWNKGTEIVFIPKENGVEVKKLEKAIESRDKNSEIKQNKFSELSQEKILEAEA